MTAQKLIAWGASPLLELSVRYNPEIGFDYCIDRSEALHGSTIEGLPICPPHKLNEENRDNILIVITAMSSVSAQAIGETLGDLGYEFNRHYVDLATFLKAGFQQKAEALFKHPFSDGNFVFARSFNMNSRTPLETTILGNWLLLETLERTSHLKGSVAEVGAYKGGNSYLQLSAMSLRKDPRTYYIFDSFQGFAEMTDHDPRHLQNAFSYDYKANQIFNSLRLFNQATVIPGFVPQTFSAINPSEKFSLVFYDCDLYQPALDTYAFFWDRLEPGGILIIHDNIATKEGWGGVRKATEEFFGPRDVVFHDFWETTMSVIFK